MGVPTKNDHFGVFCGYHHLRKHPYCEFCYHSIPLPALSRRGGFCSLLAFAALQVGQLRAQMIAAGDIQRQARCLVKQGIYIHVNSICQLESSKMNWGMFQLEDELDYTTSFHSSYLGTQRRVESCRDILPQRHNLASKSYFVILNLK